MAQLLHSDGTVTEIGHLKNNEFMTIGSAESCDIRIREPNVLHKHARLICRQTLFYIRPLSAKAITLVNNFPAAANQDMMLQHRDMITIAAWTMQFVEGALTPEAAGTLDGANRQAAQNNREDFKHRVHATLLERLDIKDLEQIGGKKRELMMDKQARAFIREILAERSEEAAALGDYETLYQEIIDDILGYGPLDGLLRDDAVSEIMCVGANKVYVEKKGRIELSSRHFQDEKQLRGVIERIVGPLGRRIDESSPIVDARLPDGSRVNAIIPPVSIDGCSLNIRKFPHHTVKVDNLLAYGSLTRGMAQFLKVAVERRRNIVIAGGTGSGKTTLLDVISSFIPSSERIVTIEDSAELRLEQEHVVRLETRPPNIEGKGAITIRDLVKNALRMRPDRIVVGECRGGEALDMLQAMNTGHDGSLTTLHANTPQDAVSRLETMVLMAGMELPLRAIRSQIASAVHIICQQARLSDGSRKITQIAEVISDPDDEDGAIKLQDIFAFHQTGVDERGVIQGSFRPSGVIPNFITKLRKQGTNVDMAMFVIDS